jgi:hypothetical protein
MSSITQYKKEKKLIEEKVQKVRQVVPTSSTNEIILALHNYDLDVERTIQAFLEEGAQGALGDWENTAKSKKSKKKNTATKADSTTSSTVDSATGTLKQQNGKSTSKATSNNNGYTNGYTNGVTTTTSSAVSASSSAVKPKQAPKITTSSNLDNLDRLNNAEKSKVLSDELNALNRHQTDLSKVQKQFDAEIVNSETSIAQCFKEIRQIAAERERQLLSALSRVREEGNYYLSARHSELRHLQSTAKDSNNEDSIVVELKRFLANKQHDLELGHVTRFVYDNSKLVNSIARFGEIVSINGAAVPTPAMHSTPSQSNEIKHATSHSSLVSSVGEDSGLGQISPVANEKNVVHVEGSGINMQSSAISSDQLAEIQRQLNEQLKAAGIDPSILSNASSTAPPPRRRPQQNSNNRKQQNGNNKKNNKPSIELSILN